MPGCPDLAILCYMVKLKRPLQFNILFLGLAVSHHGVSRSACK